MPRATDRAQKPAQLPRAGSKFTRLRPRLSGRVRDYDTIAGMLFLTDLHPLGVLGTAIDSTSLGQVGEGKLLAIFTGAGIALGVEAFRPLRSSGGAAQRTHEPHPASL